MPGDMKGLVHAAYRQTHGRTLVNKFCGSELFPQSTGGSLPMFDLVIIVNKPDATSSDQGNNQAGHSRAVGESSASAPAGNIVSRTWAKVCSWFEIPFGYEDETGFHYGHEPVPFMAAVTPPMFRDVFTDRACDSAMFMAATSSETAPAPAPERTANARREKNEMTVNPS